MARSLAALAGCLLLAGCGGGDSPGGTQDDGSGSTVDGPTIEQLWRGRAGEDVALTPGTSDYAPGSVRFTFLVIRANGETVDRPRARVWLARDRDEAPFARTSAVLEAVGVPGGAENDNDIKSLYVAHLPIDRAGTFWVLAEPVGGRAVQAIGNVVVRPETRTPSVGDEAYPSRTPTIRSEKGDFSKLTTADPPDRELLRHSIAESLRDRVAFVVAFATPKFCASRTCGPVVDVLEAVHGRFAGKRVRFIHVEIYEGNDPALGTNRWVKEWRLPSEPWVFLVGRDGRIKAKLEGSASVRELTTLVRGKLL
jgi:hypothetical protein